jgi:putative lipoic acid-binding regulatory protein
MKRKPHSIEYPREIIFKAIFRGESSSHEHITRCLSGKGLDHSISAKESGKGTFISYTIIAEFESEDLLNDVCGEIGKLEGFMTMI